MDTFVWKQPPLVSAQVQWGTMGEWAAAVGAVLLIGVTIWLWSKDRSDRASTQAKAEARDQAAEARAQDAERRAQDAEVRTQAEARRRSEDEERRRAHSLVAWLTESAGELRQVRVGV
jgi:uncharacterized protein HemX